MASSAEDKNKKAFESWLQNKSLRDASIEALEQLSNKRGDKTESVLELAISCIAIDLILQSGSGKDDEYHDSSSKKDKSAMFEPWAMWTRDRHKFENVILSESDADQMSPIMKGGDCPLLIRQKDGTWMIESLAYTYTSVAPTKMEAKKEAKKEVVLTSRQQDEFVKNKFYVRELKRVWQLAKNTLEQRRLEVISKKPPTGSLSSNNREDSKSVRNAGIDMRLLYDLGLNRMRQWIEEDEDKERNHRAEDERMRKKEALENYSAWAKQKEIIEQGRTMFHAGKKFDDWTEKCDIKRATARECWDQFESTAALAAGSGTKSRKSETLVNNSADAEKAFEDWVVQKDMRDRAVEYLSHISVTTEPIYKNGKNNNQSNSGTGKAISSSENNNALNTNQVSAKDRNRVVDVGRFLKRVDRTLLGIWADWCADVFAFNEANILWDFFDPIACDIHSSSHVRDVFLKAVKPNVNYGEIFDEFVKKKYHRSSAALNKEDMQDLLLEMGINMRLMNVEVLMDAFDTDGNGTVSRKEFVEFAKPMKDKPCCWRSCCWKTGMANAFICKVGENKNSNSNNGMFDADSKTKGVGCESVESEVRVETKGAKAKTSLAGTRIVEVDELCTKNRAVEMLPERIKREKILRGMGFGPELDKRTISENCDCKLVDRLQSSREESLLELRDMSSENRKEAILKKLITAGRPPSPPDLTCDVNDTFEDKLLLKWSPAKDDIVSFYSLEYGGLATASKAPVYAEIFVNPRRADDEFRLSFRHEGLEPGCSYLYRMRAFNGFGPGSYTYKKFTTRTSTPPAPMVLKLAHDSVTLRWSFNDVFDARMGEIKKLFQNSDSSSDGQLNRDELAHILNESTPISAELKTFFRKRLLELQQEISDDNFEAIFDEIESDDSGMISFREFESFLLSAGWCNTRSMAFSKAESKSKSAIRYILERCTSEFHNTWEVALETNNGHGTISRLEAGQSYRFRVFATNAEGVHGPYSEPCIVHTMMEMPAAPCVAGPKGLGSTFLDLVWKGRDESTRNSVAVQKVIKDFAAAHDEKDGGVSLEYMFSKYDLNKDGTIDPKELKNLLEDLGVGVSDDRLSDAFQELDKDRNGEISYEEFGNWWRSEKVSYTLKVGEPAASFTDKDLRSSKERERGELATIRENATTASATQKKVVKNVPMKVIHRGGENKHTVSGLEPNKLYHFRLRFTGPRSNSLMSPPLVIMTAPEPPSTPIVVGVASNIGHFKWYPSSRGGCYSFELQIRLIDEEKEKENEWSVVYNGQDNFWAPTTLTPAKRYEMRAFAINYEGAYSKPSSSALFSTEDRKERNVIVIPKNPEAVFAIEATDDICVGDTILITERIFSKDHMTKPPAPTPASDRIVAARTGALGVNRPNSASGANGKAVGKGVDGNKDSNKGKEKIGGGAAAAAVRMDMSTASIYSESNPLGKYIGQRTICAIVVKDNFRTMKGSIKDYTNTKKYSAFRNVWLEVMWERLSSESCKPYEHNPGDVIERKQVQLEQFEVFRKRWTDESSRLSVGKEWKLLSNCFQAPDV